MKTFLYLCGKPATGKITVGRIVQKKTGWRLFWFHDLKNAVYDIVLEHRIPELMNKVTLPVIEYLLHIGESIIYIRPSADSKTIHEIEKLVAHFPQYKFVVIRLDASYKTLVERVALRNEKYRISNKEDLDSYFADKRSKVTEYQAGHIIETDASSPEQIANKIMELI